MPCGNEKVMHYDEPAQAAPSFTQHLKAGTWLVDIEIPKKAEDGV